MRALATAILLSTTVAPAEPTSSTVVVATSDRELAAALDGALATYTPRLVRIADLPSANEPLLVTSRRIGAREHARFVVWLVERSPGSVIVLYDVATDQLRERALPFSTPLDAASATEAARAARTMIRTEGLGREVAISSTPPPIAIERPRETRLERRLAIAMQLGARPDGELAIGAAAIGRPDRIGWVIGLELARGDLEGEGFSGSISDRVLTAGVRVPIAIAKLRLRATGGLAAHLTTVDGELMDGTPVSDLRIDPAIHFGAGIGYAIHRDLEVGFALGSDLMLQRPRYIVASGEVGIVPRLRLSAGLSLSIGVR